MGTRSLTHIKGDVWEEGKDPSTILTFYRQYDGYPTGHGKDLRAFLEGFQVVNGIGGQKGKVANGMGCLAAQTIASFKNESGVGGIYVYEPDAVNVGEEWVYTVSPGGGRSLAGTEGEVQLKVYAVYRDVVASEGPVSGFDPVAVEAAVYGTDEDEDQT